MEEQERPGPRRWIRFTTILIDGRKMEDLFPEITMSEWLAEALQGPFDPVLDGPGFRAVDKKGSWSDDDWHVRSGRRLIDGVGGEGFPHGFLPIMTCCGDPHCGYTAMRLVATDTTVEWTDFCTIHPNWSAAGGLAQPLRTSLSGASHLVFAREEYSEYFQNFMRSGATDASPGVLRSANFGGTRALQGPQSKLHGLARLRERWVRLRQRRKTSVRLVESLALDRIIQAHDPLLFGSDPRANYGGAAGDVLRVYSFNEVLAEPEEVLARYFDEVHGYVADGSALERIGADLIHRGPGYRSQREWNLEPRD